MKLKGYLDKKTNKIKILNQILAQKLGLPEYEVEAGYDGSFYLKGYAPERPLPTNEEISELRSGLYRTQVDNVTCEYYRKKILNDFKDGEEEKLLKKIQDSVAKIKKENPYNKE